MSLKKWMVCTALAVSMIGGPSMAVEVSGLPDFTRIVATEGRAVVNVSTTRTERAVPNPVPDVFQSDPFFEFFKRFAPPQVREQQVASLGSGFIISSDGYVLTNAHVVAGADNITVSLTDKREFKAKLIGSDERTDVALLKIDGGNLPVVRLGKSADLKVGEWVLAIGSPFGFDNSVTAGIVSALGRQLPDEGFVPFIQTDAAVNPGNSGGPLFNLNGEVVGINSQIFSRSGGFMGISFAIPIDVALNVSSQIKAHGSVARGRIGIALQSLSKPLATSFGLERPDGALVSGVDPKGPAAKAGLRPGDIVLQANGQTISDRGDLQRIVGMAPPGTRFALKVWRNKTRVDINVVSVLWQTPATVADNAREGARPDGNRFNRLGLTVSELSVQQREQLGVPFGLLVRAVSAASEKAGLLPGDVIVGVGGSALRSTRDLESAVRSGQTNLALQVVRNGDTLFVPLVLKDAP